MLRSSASARRAADITLVALTAPVWVPVVGVLACAVLVTSGRPVFFVQDRVGRDESVFGMRKFRSMKNGDNPLIPDPERFTPLGSILRRTSLDELPQLFNVLDGSMTLVGPRPTLPEQLDRMTSDQRRRFGVRPGLTGLAQINGRNALSWDERFVFDCDWARRPTLRRYASILVRTAATVISGDGVDGHDAADPIVAGVEIDLDNRLEVVDLLPTTIIELPASPTLDEHVA